jgi:isopenicillin-N N-acyltransferase-like protein
VAAGARLRRTGAALCGIVDATMAILTYSSAPADPFTRGEALGAAFAGGVAEAWRGYERVFGAAGIEGGDLRGLGEEALEVVRGWAPALADEIAGLAAGAGVPAWQVGALNARTEILGRVRTPVPGECSTAVLVPAGGGAPRTIQTWDWLQSLRDAKLLWRIEHRDGRVVKTFTELGVLGKVGVNDAGLGVHFNFLQHEGDGGAVGVPVHLVARRILDEARTVAEAGAIAASATVSASTALTVVAYDGERATARTFELSPAGLGTIDPGPDGVLLHTNHFLDDELAAGERLAPTDPDTVARLEELDRRRAAVTAPSVADRASALVVHREDGAALCCHPDEGAGLADEWETLITLALDVDAGTLTYSDGAPCQATPDGWQTF